MKNSQKQTVNALSIDVEDYFQVSAFESTIERADWTKMPSRVVANTESILELLQQHDTKATFFVLGWVAKYYPELVKNIANAGHEVACHGFFHERLQHLSPAQFKKDCLLAKRTLEDIICKPVLGYRAPSYSLNQNTAWAHGILNQCDFIYSSSVYPIVHDLYGWPKAPRFKHQTGEGGLLEIPISTHKIGRLNLPAGGGGYFRLFPYFLSRWFIKQINNRDKESSVFYFHPWEFDPKQPINSKLSAKSRFRHYHNLSKTKYRLTKLLRDFKWSTMEDVFIKNRD